jgi:hypothetical protein
VNNLPEEVKKLEERLAALEISLGMPRMAAAARVAKASADSRRKFLAPKVSRASEELCAEIKTLARDKGLIAEYTLYEIGPEGNPAACCCCCCCCCC